MLKHGNQINRRNKYNTAFFKSQLWDKPRLESCFLKSRFSFLYEGTYLKTYNSKMKFAPSKVYKKIIFNRSKLNEIYKNILFANC